MKIFLIGMPGSGKTTLGRKVADMLSLPFVDLDKEIERRCNLTVPEIFQTKGEDFFRLQESQLLKEFAGATTSFIMATGGGAPCFYDGITVINNNGVSVFLDVPVDELVRRVAGNKDRPLLKGEDEVALRERLSNIRATRQSTYEKASVILKDPTAEKLVKVLNRQNV